MLPRTGNCLPSSSWNIFPCLFFLLSITASSSLGDDDFIPIPSIPSTEGVSVTDEPRDPQTGVIHENTFWEMLREQEKAEDNLMSHRQTDSFTTTGDSSMQSEDLTIKPESSSATNPTNDSFVIEEPQYSDNEDYGYDSEFTLATDCDPKAAPLKAIDDLIDPGYSRKSCLISPQIVTCERMKNPGEITWYYDLIEKRCLATSDCIVNENRFLSEAECEAACLPKLPITRCLAPPKAGYAQCAYKDDHKVASTTIQKAFFDKALERCSWFVYLGCGGSDNQFESIEECNTTCMTPDALVTIRNNSQEICNLPHTFSDDPRCEDLGQMASRWYFDKETKLCKEFGYSHCDGTANNFLSKSSCELFCGAKSLTQEAICELPPEVGDCGSRQPHEMWYFDSGIGDCLAFPYSGCGGNENRFPSHATCREACKPEPMVPLTKSGSSEGGKEEDEDFESGHEDPDLLSNLEQPPSIEEVFEDEPLTTDPPKEHLGIFQPIAYNLTNFTPQSVDIEPCKKRPEPGNCVPIECGKRTKCETKQLVRWFFNPRTSNCENFAYSGCGGSANTFDSAQACSVACKQRIMRPERDKRCDNDPKRDGCYNLPMPQHGKAVNETPEVFFYFSVASGTCRAFHLRKDGENCGSDLYFKDGQDCLKACSKSSPTEQDLPNRCFARKLKSGPTKCPMEGKNVSRWSYLSDLQQCVLFSECFSPDAPITSSWGNNFDSKDLCEATCMPRGLKDVCRLPKDPGPCTASEARYYYDPMLGRCRLFMYGGCLGNGNRFNTKIECEDACGALNEVYDAGALETKSSESTVAKVRKVPPVPAEVFEEMRRIKMMYSERYPWDFCLQHHTYGTCPRPRRLHSGNADHSVHLTRFFFNRKTKQCEPYFYTGCGARGNHFETKTQCDNVCSRRLRQSVSSSCDASQVEECPGSGLRLWVYEAETGTCRQLEVCPTSEPLRLPLIGANGVFALWSGVNGHLQPGTFGTSSACYKHCLPPTPSGTDVTNICHMNPITSVSNECRLMGERWYFDVKDGYCRSYISCPVYGNNFADEETCNSACRPKHISEVCRLPLDYGGCSSFLPRWYYNTEKRQCEQFLYGGCFGNSNRFLTKLECDNACAHNDVCGLPKPKAAEGNEPSTLRYFFNQTSGECEKFLFSGKIPQGNNFVNEDTCRSVCISSPNLLPISVKIHKTALSMDRLATKFKHAVRHPQVSRGIRLTCLSSPQLLNILKNETIQNCHLGGTVTELAYAYDSVTNSCFPTMIYVCLDYPNEPYRIRILGRPLIFESQTHCESECLTGER